MDMTTPENIEEILKEFEKIMTPPKYVPELQGTECIMCGSPMPDSRGMELAKSFLRQAYTAGRSSMRQDVLSVVPMEEVVSPKLLEDTWKKARMEFRSQLLTNIEGIV